MAAPLPLSRANFPKLSPLPEANSNIIAHVGVGGFHRSHQAFVLNSLISLDSSEGWSILGVGLMAGDKKMRDVLRSQDYLYSVNLRSASTNTATVVQSISDFVYVPEDGVTDKLLSAKIVSLTITERGYYLTPSGFLDTSNDLISSDLSSFSSSTFAPKTAHGLICKLALAHKSSGCAPPTVMSCDKYAIRCSTPFAARVQRARSAKRGEDSALKEREVSCLAFRELALQIPIGATCMGKPQREKKQRQ